MSPIDKKSIVN